MRGCRGGLCPGRVTQDGECRLASPALQFAAASALLPADFSLLVGLSVALAVFLCVTLLSVQLLRRKERGPAYSLAASCKSCPPSALQPPSPTF